MSGAPRLVQAVPPLVVGGRYRVVRTLGRGSEGTAFLVEDLFRERWVALQVPAPGVDEARLRRFVTEASVLARLSHPHLIRVVGRITLACAPAILTELAPGGTVAAWMRRNGTLSPSAAVGVVRQCAEGLAHAHAAGILHRDVKPANVLIRESGSVALADFGAALCRTDQGTEQPGSFLAPEQLADPDEVGEPADVYGLGATLHRLCTGRRERELFRAPIEPRVLGGLPPLLATVVARCCRFGPADRPSLSELRTLLDRARSAYAGRSDEPPLFDGPFHRFTPVDPGARDADVDALRSRLLRAERERTPPPAPSGEAAWSLSRWFGGSRRRAST